MATTILHEPAVVSPDCSLGLNRVHLGPEWSSFEQFRKGGDQNLRLVRSGAVGTLHAKSGVYRILSDEDFQALIGLASEVTRIQSGLTTVAYAAHILRENPTSDSAAGLLQHILGQYAKVPQIPSRQGNEPSSEQQALIDPDDEVILDPTQLRPAERR